MGSKTVYLKDTPEHSKNGVIITNTAIDGIGVGLFSGGLYDLIHQTATLLADNIISINCCQINSRVTTFFTGDSPAKCAAGAAVLKKMYAGAPFQILEQDLVEKININPIAQSTTSKTITELVELHNYIISNFFQSIGIRANSIMKRERLITDEIDSQNNFVQLSLVEIMASWQRGFDEVNKMYGTEIKVELNPVLLEEILDDFVSGSSEPETETTSSEPSPDPAEDTEPEQQQEPDTETASSDPDPEEEPEPEPEQQEPNPAEKIEEQEEIIEDIIDIVNDAAEDPEPEEGEEDVSSEEEDTLDSD